MTAPEPTLLDLEARAAAALERVLTAMESGEYARALRSMHVAAALQDAQVQRVEAVLETYEDAGGGAGDA